MKDNKYKEKVNQEITAPSVRVIDENGNSIGILNIQEARKIASSRGYDLVEVSPNAKPPVCKICDYGKFNFERHKKEKLQKKHQSVMTIKEIRFSANTDKHDTEFKCRHLKQFLLDGHKIKVTVIYKGRMITHPEIGQKLMEEILSKILEVGKLESSPRMEGKFFIAYLIPDKNKITAYKEKLKHLNESEQNIKPEAKKAAVQKPIEEKVNIDGKIEMNTEAKENIEEKN